MTDYEVPGTLVPTVGSSVVHSRHVANGAAEVATVAALRVLLGTEPVPPVIVLRGVNGGTFEVGSSVGLTDDGGVTLIEGDLAAVRQRPDTRVSDPRWWGAACDGVTDDTDAFEAACAYGLGISLTDFRDSTKGNQWGDAIGERRDVLVTGTIRLTSTITSRWSALSIVGTQDSRRGGSQTATLLLDHAGDGINCFAGYTADNEDFQAASLSVRGVSFVRGSSYLDQGTAIALRGNAWRSTSAVVGCAFVRQAYGVWLDTRTKAGATGVLLSNEITIRDNKFAQCGYGYYGPGVNLVNSEFRHNTFSACTVPFNVAMMGGSVTDCDCEAGGMAVAQVNSGDVGRFYHEQQGSDYLITLQDSSNVRLAPSVLIGDLIPKSTLLLNSSKVACEQAVHIAGCYQIDARGGWLTPRYADASFSVIHNCTEAPYLVRGSPGAIGDKLDDTGTFGTTAVFDGVTLAAAEVTSNHSSSFALLAEPVAQGTVAVIAFTVRYDTNPGVGLGVVAQAYYPGTGWTALPGFNIPLSVPAGDTIQAVLMAPMAQAATQLIVYVYPYLQGGSGTGAKVSKTWFSFLPVATTLRQFHVPTLLVE